MNIIQYLKEKGIKRALQVIWQYKLEIILEKIVYILTKNKPLQDKILIESHNDFDCNGGAFYDYLIKEGYNKKYKIVWLVRKKVKNELPENVETVPLYGPSLKKAYHICTAKYVTFDCEGVNKLRKEQKVVYCSHGAGGLKNIKGKLNLPDTVDYILLQSPNYAPIQTEQWGIDIKDKRLTYIGYPSFDILHSGNTEEIKKITNNKYNKVILWMPTFRKGGGLNRNDSLKEQALGIPLFNNLEEYNEINEYFKKNESLLIIKIHPKQDLSDLKIQNKTNIKVLTADTVKVLNINNYKLMNCSDALISDYSGAAYEYLQTDKPIAYVLDDMKEYKQGFVVEDIHTLIAGQEIYNLSDFKKFVSDIINEIDLFKQRRKEVREYIYNINDGNSCKRLAELLKINNDK